MLVVGLGLCLYLNFSLEIRLGLKLVLRFRF